MTDDPYDILIQGLAQLEKELGRPFPMSLSEQEVRELTPEAARKTLSHWRELARQGVI